MPCPHISIGIPNNYQECNGVITLLTYRDAITQQQTKQYMYVEVPSSLCI